MSRQPSYYRSSIKNEVRNLLADHCPKQANVLTLAGPYAKDAKLLIERCGAKVSSIEHDSSRFQDQKRLTKYQREFFKFQGEAVKLLPWLIEHAEPYNLIFLDFCGPYGPTNEQTIQLALKALAPGGVLALTFLQGRENQLQETRLCREFLERGPQEYLQARMHGVRAIMQHFGREAGMRLQCVVSQEYRNSYKDASEMMFFLYKHIKNEKKICALAARKFKTRKQWQLGNNRSYQFARKRGWLSHCCKHMPLRAKRMLKAP
jgi:hypothetical protein